jgi:hypothetical protein
LGLYKYVGFPGDEKIFIPTNITLNMDLRKYDFNHKTGYGAIILISMAISLCFFSVAYMSEGLGWLSDYEDDGDELYLDVGWNWIRGSGLAFLVALAQFIFSWKLLQTNKKISGTRPMLGKLDLNQRQGYLGLVSLSISFIFFINAALYWWEAEKWFFGGLYPGNSWFLNEASAWATSAWIMGLVGILLSAIGWVLLAKNWKKR